MLTKLDRWSRRAVMVMMLLLPAILYGAAHIPIGSASVHEWLPDGQLERERYEQFLKHFGTDQFMLISWEGCSASDPRVERFVTEVEQLPEGGKPYVDSVRSTRQFVEMLTAEPLGLPVREAVRRLRGTLIGPNGLCAVVASVTPYGLKHQGDAMEHVYQAADRVDGLGREHLRMAGTIYEAHAVDAAAESSLKQLVIPSMVIGIVLACVCLRTPLAAIAVLVMAGIGTLLAIMMVYISGGQFSAVLIVLPTLVFMLTLSSAVHLMHYYVDVSTMHTDHLGSRAMLLGFKPSLFASVTTALGMASLIASQLSPVREFGIYSSLSLCVATAFLLIAFPALSDWFYAKKALAVAERKRRLVRGKFDALANPAAAPIDAPLTSGADEPVSATALAQEAESIIEADTHSPMISPLARRYTAWMNRHAWSVSIVGIGLILLSVYGLMYLEPSTKFDDMFPTDSPTIRDMKWLEDNLGPIASVEILMRFPVASTLDAYERIEWVDRVCQAIQKDEQLGYALSATTFLPSLPQSGSLRDVARRSVLRKRLAESLPQLKDRGWLAESDEGQVWRVTAKISATSAEDYGILTNRVVNRVMQLPRDNAEALPFDIEFTGLYPVMHSTQLSLIDDLQISFTAAFILITPVMMLIARGFWAGLLIMIPNVLPETLVFGLMAWIGFRLDIAGLLTASVAMGIAVNDTLHMVNWYARRLAAGDSRTQALADTLSSCAAAMFHTMLISCCSMLPFLFAEFLPTRQFAFLMIAMLSSALLGDLVLLPGLLLSPLGLCLMPRAAKATEDNEAAEVIGA